MKQTISRFEFFTAFEKAGRGDQFSRPALNALFDYFEEFEESTGEEIELDVIGICCDYTEDSIGNVLRDYRLKSIEELEESTVVIYKDDEDVLYENF